ncbi:MAG TPA: hypothetical protein VD866_21080 [Urbifossiella sp.]|nr:hypothetical protein [Urbifossiella sp.]
MSSRRIALWLLALAGLVALWAIPRREPGQPSTDPSVFRPSDDEVAHRFGGGSAADPERDAALRRQVVGRWGRSDSDLVYLDFAADGGLRGADMTSDPVAVAEGRASFTAREYVGRWEINNGFLRVQKPNTLTSAGGYMTSVTRLRFTDAGRLELFDSIERVDQAQVYHLLPAAVEP